MMLGYMKGENLSAVKAQSEGDLITNQEEG